MLNPYQYIRKRLRPTTYALLVALGAEILLPIKSYALTSGPSQPEVQSFEPVETSQMVEPSSGDFTYNIPLLEVSGPNGGYPINLAYHSGIAADQEASWTGLGWNLNVGNINRNMRGIPDEFNKDKIIRKQDMKPNFTVGVSSSFDFEAVGLEKKKGAPSVSVGGKIYYNSYKGFGIGTELGVSMGWAMGDNMSANGGFKLSSDSQEGVGVSPSLGIGFEFGDAKQKSLGLSIAGNYNSRAGLMGISVGANFEQSKAANLNKGKWGKGAKASAAAKTRNQTSMGVGGSSYLSFAGGTYAPQVATAMQGSNFTGHVKLGGGTCGLYGNLYVSGFFNQDKMAYAGMSVATPAYGYNNYQYANRNTLSDFIREKDGSLHKNTNFIGMPVTQYDIYSVMGQGIGSMFRPHRSEIGILRDPDVRSSSAGGSLGVETGFQHVFGISGEMNNSESSNPTWANVGDINSVYNYATSSPSPNFEPYYYKTYGEMTSSPTSDLANIGGTEAVAVNLTGGVTDAIAETKLKSSKGRITNCVQADRSVRKPRNVAILEIKNNRINPNDGILNEFDVKHYTNAVLSNTNAYANSNKVNFTRSRPSHHIGGFSTTNAEGMQYIYALPAYNNVQKERTFSVPSQGLYDCNPLVDVPMANGAINYKVDWNSERFYDETVTPAYPHAYLLTSVLGNDYVDVDNNGASDKDMGYWAKFEYIKTSGNYKWRAPFAKANFQKGLDSKASDDKGSFVYGEKEMWYLGTIETKTHIAEFYLSPRNDARGAADEFQTTNGCGEYSYKLDSIALFVKADRMINGVVNPNATPIKKVHFEYDYSLCKLIPNNPNSTNNIAVSGKLTLKKVWFTYKKNTRGSLTPYIFDYHENILAENPNYQSHNYDRWGNYKPKKVGELDCAYQNSPYVPQFNPPVNAVTFRQEIDRNAAVWNLKEIKLPSGGSIKIEYESDDYAYVQNKTAGQMHKITSVLTPSANNSDWRADTKKRIYFDLEVPLFNNANGKKEVEKLLDKPTLVSPSRIARPLAFKIYTDLKTDNSNEYVSGYVEVKDWGLDPTSVNPQTNKCGRAFVELLPTRAGKRIFNNYHPLAIAAWNHLKLTRPEIAYAPSVNMGDPDNLKKKEKLKKIASLLSVVTQLRPFITGFYSYAKSKNFARNIDLSRSYIRLNSQDKIKYGGGCRVKKLSLSNNWQQGTELPTEYGQTYEYTTTENGKTISSGVATYEPSIGAEEISLRSPKYATEHVPLMTPVNLLSELPVLESYFPAPSVIYGKVRVKSLTTEKILQGTLPSEISSTGVVEHEFYTAKDFPTLTSYTNPIIKSKTNRIPLLFLGQITEDYFTISQGFAVELNDMAGKPKAVSNYALDATGKVSDKPYRWVKYDYKTEKTAVTANGEVGAKKLNNEVSVLLGEGQTATRLMGLEYEMFSDSRQTVSTSSGIGLNFNLDLALFFPMPSAWPSISRDRKQIRAIATTKVIHRFGIMTKETHFEEGSIVTTENKVFDALTGQPLLTSVTNEYDEPIYNYTTPARWSYSGMGAAYLNLGMEFSASGFTLDPPTQWFKASIPPNIAALLHAGDEYLATSSNNTKSKAYCMKVSSNEIWIDGIGAGDYRFFITRSGRRNLLTTPTSNVSALKNPLTNRTTITVN